MNTIFHFFVIAGKYRINPALVAERICIGSDFDGVGDSLPLGLKDVSEYPNLIAELLRRGYSPDDIAKVCYKNVFRVWNEVISISQNAG